MALRTIILSDREWAINEDYWPVLAEAEAVRSAARSAIRVRQHEDTPGAGLVVISTIVYGEAGNVRYGVLIQSAATGQICEAIKTVAARMESAVPETSWTQLADDCIADMPVVALVEHKGK